MELNDGSDDEGKKQNAKRKAQEEELDPWDKFQSLLDTPFFDPEEDGGPNEPQFMREFKEMIKTDYYRAENLFGFGFLAIMVILSQQGVSVYKHCYFSPDSLCPWDVRPWDVLDSL